MPTLSSRERMLRAIDCQPVDHPPCCFMLLHAMEDLCKDDFELVEKQLDWGLDPMVRLPQWIPTGPGDPLDLRVFRDGWHADVHISMRGLPVHCHPAVQIREWVAPIEGERYPILHKEYLTPEGTLSTQVRKTDDWPDYWPYGDHVPFIDDLNIPRARKPLVAGPEDLRALSYLLGPPDEDAVEYFRASSRANRELAKELDLLTAYEWGILADMAAWLCGLEPLIYLSADKPEFVEDLMQVIATWNLEMMRVVLDEGVDLWLRRAWYETCHFWTPATYRQFILPHLKQEVELAHSRGVKFGYIMTSGIMPLLDMILEAEVDVLIGVDPSMGGADLRALKEKTQGKMCLWGGVDGPLTVDRGTTEQVRKAVTVALDILAPGNGFILSPVDGIYSTSEHTWNNVREFIETWQAWG